MTVAVGVVHVTVAVGVVAVTVAVGVVQSSSTQNTVPADVVAPCAVAVAVAVGG